MGVQTIEIEKVDGMLVGRIYVSGRKTSAYIILSDENRHLFSPAQIKEIDEEIF